MMRTCAHCGATIYLIQVGIKTWKWVTDVSRTTTWKCRGDAEHPMRGHAP